MSFKFTMEPRVSYLSELLKEIYEGFLKIPRFQRKLVWKRQQQRELLCSIFEGLPIGALLVWSTRLKNINTYDSIGPFPIESSSGSVSNMYLMDGLQRLSTLYSVLLHPVERLEGSDESMSAAQSFSVYCDLAAQFVEDIFIFEDELPASYKSNRSFLYMPLNLVFKSKELLKFQRTIPADQESLLDRSDAIVTAFKNYKIPVIPLESDDQALVTKSFERINSRGTVMSETHMLNALSYSDQFDLLSSIERHREEYFDKYTAWRDIDSEFILMLLKLSLGYDLYSKDTDKLAKSINELSVTSVFKAINALADFAQSDLDISAPSQFPYRLQMLGIAHSYMTKEASNVRFLRDWFYITTYSNSFGTTARNSQRALSDLQRYMDTGVLNWTLSHKPVIQSLSNVQVNKGAARVKAWMLALAKKLRDSDPLNHQFEQNKYSLSLPKEFRGRERRPGFYFLIPDNRGRSFNFDDLSVAERSGHFLDDQLLQLYHDSNFEAFAEVREKLMFDWEQSNFIQPAAFNAGLEELIQPLADNV